MLTNKTIFRYLREYFNKLLNEHFESYITGSSSSSIEGSHAAYRTLLTAGTVEDRTLKHRLSYSKDIFTLLLGFNKSYETFSCLKNIKSIPLVYDTKMCDLVENSKDSILNRFKTRPTLRDVYMEKPITTPKVKRAYFNKNNINYIKFDPNKQIFYGLTYDSVVKSMFETYKEAIEDLFRHLNITEETKIEEFLKGLLDGTIVQYKIQFKVSQNTNPSIAFYVYVFKSPDAPTSESSENTVTETTTISYENRDAYTWSILGSDHGINRKTYHVRTPTKIVARLGTIRLQEFPVTKVITNTFDIVKGHQAELFKNKVDTYIKSVQKTFNNFSVLTGDFISHYYHANRYTVESKDTLHSSCMRNNSNPIFYSAFPENIGMLSLFDRIGKLKGRGILWEGYKFPTGNISSRTIPEIGELVKEENKIKIVDRVYYDSPETYNLFVAYCNNKDIKTCYASQNGIRRLDGSFITVLPDLSLEQLKILSDKYNLFTKVRERGRTSPSNTNAPDIGIMEMIRRVESDPEEEYDGPRRRSNNTNNPVLDTFKQLFSTITWPYMDSLGHIRKVKVNGEIKLALTNESGRTYSNFTAEFISYYAEKFPEYAKTSSKISNLSSISAYKKTLKRYIDNTEDFPIIFEGKKVVFDSKVVGNVSTGTATEQTIKALEVLKNTIGEIVTTLGLSPIKQLTGPSKIENNTLVNKVSILNYNESIHRFPYMVTTNILEPYFLRSNFNIFILTSALFKNLVNRDITDWEYSLISNILILRLGAKQYLTRSDSSLIDTWITNIEGRKYIIPNLSLENIEDREYKEISYDCVSYAYDSKRTVIGKFESTHPEYTGLFNSYINDEVILERTAVDVIPILTRRWLSRSVEALEETLMYNEHLSFTGYIDKIFRNKEKIEFSNKDYQAVVDKLTIANNFKQSIREKHNSDKIKIKFDTKELSGKIYYNVLGQDIPIKNVSKFDSVLYRHSSGTYGIFDNLKVSSADLGKIVVAYVSGMEYIAKTYFPEHVEIINTLVKTFSSDVRSRLLGRIHDQGINWKNIREVLRFYIQRIFNYDTSLANSFLSIDFTKMVEIVRDYVLQEVFENEITVMSLHESNSISIEFLDCLSKYTKKETTKSDKPNE